jgi:hypothetical protein
MDCFYVVKRIIKEKTQMLVGLPKSRFQQRARPSLLTCENPFGNDMSMKRALILTAKPLIVLLSS